MADHKMSSGSINDVKREFVEVTAIPPRTVALESSATAAALPEGCKTPEKKMSPLDVQKQNQNETPVSTVRLCPNPTNSNLKNAVTLVKWTKVWPVPAPAQRPRTYIPMPRHGHRAVSINNIIIVFGGGNEGIFADVIVFDTHRREWFKPKAQGDIPPGRAAFGIAVREAQNTVLIFGGMLEYCEYANDIYELYVPTWEWRKLTPKGYLPCPRIGHTFTLVGDRAFLFGGLANITGDPSKNIPQYLNDLCTFYQNPKTPDGVWQNQMTFGSPPSPRESHSAVAYSSKDARHNKLIIFGGMFGRRLGDLYAFDVDTLMWSKLGDLPHSPLPRSLHSACLVGERMYIFGGWMDVNNEEQKKHKCPKIPMYDKWKCTNALACLNVETMSWEMVNYYNSEPPGTPVLPCPRAGQCAVVVNNRMYIWSGRDGYKKITFDAKDTGMLQVCCEDMWYLEVQKPSAPITFRKFHTPKPNTLPIRWDPVPGADSYIVQIMNCEGSPETSTGAQLPTLKPSGMICTPSRQSNPKQLQPFRFLSTSGMVPTSAPASQAVPALSAVTPDRYGVSSSTHTPQRYALEQRQRLPAIHSTAVTPYVPTARAEATGIPSISHPQLNPTLQVSSSSSSNVQSVVLIKMRNSEGGLTSFPVPLKRSAPSSSSFGQLHQGQHSNILVNGSKQHFVFRSTEGMQMQMLSSVAATSTTKIQVIPVQTMQRPSSSAGHHAVPNYSPSPLFQTNRQNQNIPAPTLVQQQLQSTPKLHVYRFPLQPQQQLPPPPSSVPTMENHVPDSSKQKKTSSQNQNDHQKNRTNN